MTADLRATLVELAEQAGPELEALSPARRAVLARQRAQDIRRRRLVGRSLAAAAVAVLAVAGLRLTSVGTVQPAKPPYPGTERLAQSIEGRDLLGSASVEVDGDPVRLVVTPPDTDVEVRFFCSRQDEVELRVSIAGSKPALVGGCDDDIQSTSRSAEDWNRLGVRSGRAVEFTISAVSTRPPSPAELETPTWAFVGVYGSPASVLPARPAPVPGTTGLRRVASVTLYADHWRLPLVLRLPPSGTVFAAASCAGPADGLDWMVHLGDQMIGSGECRLPGPPVPLDPAPRTPGQQELITEVLVDTNYDQDLSVRRPGTGAQVVVSFYVRAGE